MPSFGERLRELRIEKNLPKKNLPIILDYTKQEYLNMN